ncbi:primary-amine oxidase [Kineococcus xinjiangensis]|uniref:Amine oxidase n=1 Tax=Kineococcus xinjiangensis TaxID=512762 RepID=A0A2S6IDY9_9ACTN|nr:primary-amine oxidase [Kineococcus xinjiangensis]PPK92421.1 primary-amine oxidase [Kineococcus xinjiangensis]
MTRHPLTPLSAEEFDRSRSVLQESGRLLPSMRFASVSLAEPPKADVLAWREGDPVPRRALSVLWDRAGRSTHEAVVDLVAGEVVSFDHVPGVTPNFTVDEYHECERAVKADPDVVAALAARGITDLGLVLIDVWTYGLGVMPEQWRDRRLGWCDVWRRETPLGSPYAHHVQGVKPIVDMDAMRVVHLDVADEIAPPAPVMGEYEPELVAAKVPGFRLREDVRALDVTQPEGPSFTVEDGELRWQKWRMRLGFTGREGLVLHRVRYDDDGTERSIAHRMSFAEMVVPYRDAGFDHYRRTAYDIGEWGLGYMTTSLALGCDCLGEIRYVDAVLADSKGEPYTVPNAVCLHEEDDAVLWKHVDANGRAQVRRSRRMVVSFHATVANYEYLVYWRFYTDGNIECEVRATGIMVTTPLPEGAPVPATGTLVDERTYAPFHQHFIVARLDLDVDGPENTVLEVDSAAAPIGPGNPHGLAVTTTATAIESESQAGRDVDWAAQRSWKVQHATKRNGLGTPVGYKLVATSAIPHMFDPQALQFLRAPVIGHDVWVTRHHDDELWPAGNHPTQSESDSGMTRWIADDEPLVGTDVVLWHVFGIHHITRPEDWPVMPADVVSFWLKPSGFFDRNPALDLPPSPGARHGSAQGGPSCH